MRVIGCDIIYGCNIQCPKAVKSPEPPPHFMMINKELLGCSNLLLNLRLEGYCAASSAVIGQIHWDFLPITGLWWDLNNFPLEADKTAFFFLSFINLSFKMVTRRHAAQGNSSIDSKSRQRVSVAVLCLERVKDPLELLYRVITCYC